VLSYHITAVSFSIVVFLKLMQEDSVHHCRSTKYLSIDIIYSLCVFTSIFRTVLYYTQNIYIYIFIAYRK